MFSDRPYFLYLFVFLLLPAGMNAQSKAQQKAAQRYEVDAKRMGVDPNSEDALPRSREFIRIDSSYYVGWMFEGAYKYNHAADFVGFKNASIPLERALRLLERDYRQQLATRTSDVMTYIQVYKYQIDYAFTVNYLVTCYSNMEQADKVYALLRRVAGWNFQRDAFDVYNHLGWTVHRNRFYTTAKYPFLAGSIAENEKLAHRYLDSGMRKIQRNQGLNSKIFQPGYDLPDKLSVYHYKSILYSYALRIDSGAYYYNLLRVNHVLPHSNYATFRAICGDFREAEAEYKTEASTRTADRRLQEWAYYLPTLYVYKGLPKAGVQMERDMIRASGSTPGFGWYNIALARSLLYDGQLGEAQRTLNKAAEFKELHIGTTLGQSHYDFSIQLLKLLAKQNQVQAQRFENKNWWYSPTTLGRIGGLTGEQYMQQFLIINQFAQNPERDQVIYKLFSTESTVSWDEIWYLVSDFSTRFFVDRFEKSARTDDRKYIKKYFRFFVARLKMKQGDYKEAMKLLNEVLGDPAIDAEYEKLLLARVFQAQAECAKELEDNAVYDDRMYRMYQFYPQLIPYSGLKMNMRMQVIGSADPAVVERLQSCNVNWQPGQAMAPTAYIRFTGSGDKKRVEYYVTDNGGKTVVAKQSMPYKDAAVGGQQLAYRLFNIGGKTPEKDAAQADI